MKQQQILEIKKSIKNQAANIAILGAGGLGMAAIQILSKKKEMKPAAIADKTGCLVDLGGITPQILENNTYSSFRLLMPNQH